MKKSEILTVAVLLLIVIGLGVVAYSDYSYRHKTETKQTASLVSQRDQYKSDLVKAQATIANQNAQITGLTTEKGHFCGVLATHKLTDALCQPE